MDRKIDSLPVPVEDTEFNSLLEQRAGFFVDTLRHVVLLTDPQIQTVLESINRLVQPSETGIKGENSARMEVVRDVVTTATALAHNLLINRPLEINK